MPTAAEYRDAAQRYRTIAEQLSREASGVGGWALGCVGEGIVRDAVVASFGHTRIHLRAAGDDMWRLARVCDARADVCRRYADAVRRHHRRTPLEQLLHGLPVRPATWVEW